MHPAKLGPGHFPRYGNGYMHQFGHVYALQQELLAGRRCDWFHATELWHTARHEGLALNAAHYTNILRQCVPAAQWAQSLLVLRQMRRDAIRPDVVGVGCALAACVEARQWQAALATFEHFRQKKVHMDNNCLRAAVAACNQGGRWESALALGAGAGAQQPALELLPATYAGLLEACETGGQVEVAFALVRRLAVDDGWTPDAAAHVAPLRRLCYAAPTGSGTTASVHHQRQYAALMDEIGVAREALTAGTAADAPLASSAVPPL